MTQFKPVIVSRLLFASILLPCATAPQTQSQDLDARTMANRFMNRKLRALYKAVLESQAVL